MPRTRNLADLLSVIQKRQTRQGITTAFGYLHHLQGCLEGSGNCPWKSLGNTTEREWRRALKASKQVLTYHEDGMGIEHGYFGDLSKKATMIADLPPRGLCLMDVITTTTRQDRDGDVLESKGADVDAAGPVLWQHVPFEPIGKLVRVLKKTAKSLAERIALIDSPMGNDAAALAEFGALRISHGFLPKEWEPLDPDDPNSGFHIKSFEIMERSLVSVPSNPDAVILAFSRQKLHSPMIKGWAKRLFDIRPKTAPGWTPKASGKKDCGCGGKGKCECEGKDDDVAKACKAAGADDECVRDKIGVLMEEGKDREQAIAMAISMCKEDAKKAKAEGEEVREADDDGKCPECGGSINDGVCSECGAKVGREGKTAKAGGAEPGDCPECGETMKDGKCPSCGYTEKGDGKPAGECPECGGKMRFGKCEDCGYSAKDAKCGGPGSGKPGPCPGGGRGDGDGESAAADRPTPKEMEEIKSSLGASNVTVNTWGGVPKMTVSFEQKEGNKTYPASATKKLVAFAKTGDYIAGNMHAPQSSMYSKSKEVRGDVVGKTSDGKLKLEWKASKYDDREEYDADYVEEHEVDSANGFWNMNLQRTVKAKAAHSLSSNECPKCGNALEDGYCPRCKEQINPKRQTSPAARLHMLKHDPLRWNRKLSKAFDVESEEFDPTCELHTLVRRYLGCDMKDVHNGDFIVPTFRMGSYLTSIGEIFHEQTDLKDLRNIDSNNREAPPEYDTVQLNSKMDREFLMRGTEFRIGDNGLRFVVRYSRNFSGMTVEWFAKRGPHTAVSKMFDTAWENALGVNNFLKGEAFSLSGEFLERTSEGWDDVFLEEVNRKAMKKLVAVVNDKGKAMANRGVILMGPPGTGKTLSGRILRNTAKSAFIWISSRDFWYSGAFGGIMQAFDLAKELAPAVIFMEDIDNWLSDTTIDMVKTEMDGIGRHSGVVTCMTTNFPQRLPEALIDRPGRFHDVLKFDLPDEDCRSGMLRKWLPDMDAKHVPALVSATKGMSGAHLYELCQFAKSILEDEDGLSLFDAAKKAVSKVKEQREMIDAVQAAGSFYRPQRRATEAIAKAAKLHAKSKRKPTTEKAGRVLSKANETRLQDVQGDIDEILKTPDLARSVKALARSAKNGIDEVLASVAQTETEGTKSAEQFIATIAADCIAAGDSGKLRATAQRLTAFAAELEKRKEAESKAALLQELNLL